MFEEGISLSSPVVTKSPNIFIGSHSYMNDGGYIRANTFIGRYCSIGRRVTIAAGIHDVSKVSTSPVLNSKDSPYTPEQLSQLGITIVSRRYTVLENDVWVGDGAIIMPGLRIQTGSVIGANSVVTRDIPPYAVVCGAPARIIKYRFPENIIQQLLETEYWEFSKHSLGCLPTGNVFEFINSVRMIKDDKYNYTYPTYTMLK